MDVSRRLVEAENDQLANYNTIREECHHDPGKGMEWEADNAWDGHGEWFYSVQRMLRVDPADVATLRKYFAG
jgi:N-acetyl-anhydromuramyl-L-alanine amidase AmpD